MGWHYDFYKIYITKQEDVDSWNHKNWDELPKHLQFFSKESHYDYTASETEEIMRFIKPIKMYEEGKLCNGFLATLYPVALFGRDGYILEYKLHKSGWYHFIKLTNSKSKYLITSFFKEWKQTRPYYSKEVLNGYLGREKNEYKTYPGKFRNIVYIFYQ